MISLHAILTILILASPTAAAAIGLWLLLPSGRGTLALARRRVVGALLAAVGFGLFASQLPVVGEWFAEGLLGAIGIVTVAAAVATISCRSPVYSAIWFGMTLAGTAALFLFAGAAFLAVATVVVYAGAILVMFLFVLMLAQPEGHTTYDRRSWEAPVSAFTGAVLVGVLTATIAAAATETEMGLPAPTNSAATRRAVAPRGARARPQAQPKNASFPRPSLVPQGREDSSVASYDARAAGRGPVHALPCRRRGGGRAALRGVGWRGGHCVPRPRGNERTASVGQPRKLNRRNQLCPLSWHRCKPS